MLLTALALAAIYFVIATFVGYLMAQRRED